MTDIPEPWRARRFRLTWAAIRWGLGITQMIAAMTTALLVIQTGVNWLTCLGVVITGCLMILSRFLFHRRSTERKR
jgi:hypothetical protein